MPDVLAYQRTADEASCVVVLNMTGHERSVRLDLPGRDAPPAVCEPDPLADGGRERRPSLAPYEVYVAAVE